jgi:hypothetical protein
MQLKCFIGPPGLRLSSVVMIMVTDPRDHELGRLSASRILPSLHDLSQRQPGDLAGAIAVIAVGRPTEGAGQFPLLRFVAPLNGGVGDDVVGLAA